MATNLQKAGRSEYYELVTVKNAYFDKAQKDCMLKNKTILDGMVFQRGLEEEALGNVDNGISIFNGLNYRKLPHIINWNTTNGSKKPIPLKAV